MKLFSRSKSLSACQGYHVQHSTIIVQTCSFKYWCILMGFLSLKPFLGKNTSPSVSYNFDNHLMYFFLVYVVLFYSINWQHRHCKNPRSNPDIRTFFVDHTCDPPNGARRTPSPANNSRMASTSNRVAFPAILSTYIAGHNCFSCHSQFIHCRSQFCSVFFNICLSLFTFRCA